MIAMFLFCLTLCFAVVVGYWFGGQGSTAQVNSQEKQISALEQDLEKLRGELTDALTKEQEAEMRYRSLENEMQSVMPSDGPLRTLLDLLKKRLEEGASIDRLTMAVKSARPPQNCSDPNTKRFVVKTLTYTGKESKAVIDNGLVNITATGESAINQNGEPEAWFDQGKPVKIEFISKDKKLQTKKGILPISSTMVVEDREYRFTLSAGPKSFIRVTYDSCDYP